jgi:hypothetical protein
MDQACTSCDAWKQHQVQGGDWPDTVQEAVQVLDHRLQEEMLMPRVTGQAHMDAEIEDPDDLPDSMPEQRELEEWFHQFDPQRMVEAEDSIQQEVKTASEEEDSEDPRTVLNNLRDNVVGWDERFEKDPKAVLDDIDAALAKLQQMKDS